MSEIIWHIKDGVREAIFVFLSQTESSREIQVSFKRLDLLSEVHLSQARHTTTSCHELTPLIKP